MRVTLQNILKVIDIHMQNSDYWYFLTTLCQTLEYEDFESSQVSDDVIGRYIRILEELSRLWTQ